MYKYAIIFRSNHRHPFSPIYCPQSLHHHTTATMTFLKELHHYCNGFIDEEISTGNNKIEFTEDAGQELQKWIEAKSRKLLVIIDGGFWTRHNLSKPNVITNISPISTDNAGRLVLFIIVWASCSRECSVNICRCLEHGMNNWETDEKFHHINWVEHYVILVTMSVWYSHLEIMREVLKKKRQDRCRSIPATPRCRVCVGTGSVQYIRFV